MKKTLQKKKTNFFFISQYAGNAALKDTFFKTTVNTALINKLYNHNLKIKVIKLLIFKKEFIKKINIRVSQNNLFCTLEDKIKNKTIYTASSGIYRLKISKRKLKHFFKTFIAIFFAKIRKTYTSLNNTIFQVVAPVKIRKKLCRIIQNEIKSFKLQKLNVLLQIVPKKCFNGCQAKKKLRKKRRLYRIYK